MLAAFSQEVYEAHALRVAVVGDAYACARLRPPSASRCIVTCYICYICLPTLQEVYDARALRVVVHDKGGTRQLVTWLSRAAYLCAAFLHEVYDARALRVGVDDGAASISI
jgi:hypothetical protein